MLAGQAVTWWGPGYKEVWKDGDPCSVFGFHLSPQFSTKGFFFFFLICLFGLVCVSRQLDPTTDRETKE